MSYQSNFSLMQTAITTAATNVAINIFNFLPTLIGAILILVIGVIVANWIKRVVKKLLELVKINKLIQNSGVQDFFEQADVQGKAEEGISEVFRWLVLLVFFIAAMNVVGLGAVSSLLTNVLQYVPRVISASLVLAAGILVAGWVERVIKGAVGSLGAATGRLLGKIGSWTIVIFVALAAISELGIAAYFINTMFIGVVAMLSLGFGLAFGLGAKDIVGQVLKEWYLKLKKDLKSE